MIQEYTDELNNFVQDALKGVHTIVPGRVTSFDADRCEASVMPCGKFRLPNGKPLDYPLVTGVPVWFPVGGGAAIAYPVREGDGCLLLTSEVSLELWRSGTDLGADLRFDLTNAVALVGLPAKPNPLVRESAGLGAVMIESGGARVTLLPGGVVEIAGAVTIKGTLTVEQDLIVRGQSHLNNS